MQFHVPQSLSVSIPLLPIAMPWPAFWTCSCFLPTLLLLLCSSLCPMFCPCLCPLAAFFHVWFSGFLCCLQCQGHPVWLHEFLHVLHEGLRLLQVSWKGLCLKAKTLAAAGSPESHSSASLDGKMFKKTAYNKVASCCNFPFPSFCLFIFLQLRSA